MKVPPDDLPLRRYARTNTARNQRLLANLPLRVCFSVGRV